ncbi:MAG: hypothetical protein AAF333_15850 [Planctomycetota bacterium]
MQMFRPTTIALAMAALLLAPFAAAQDHDDHNHPIPEVPAHPLFDQFKTLEGTWTGTVTHGENGEAQPATVTYRLTAGGTALMETVFAGTPMEMVSMYYLDGDNLKMTHYCLANNQPTMVAVADPESNGKVVHLRFDSITNMPDPNAMHMHEATFEFLGDDHHRSTWQGYVGGQPASDMCAVLDLRRQPVVVAD